VATLGAPTRAAAEAVRDEAATDMVTTDARGTARTVLVLPATSKRNSVDIIVDPSSVSSSVFKCESGTMSV
jgi:hypothetical protein